MKRRNKKMKLDLGHLGMLAVILAMLIASCGKLTASSYYAKGIPVIGSGVTCYVILADENPVGGNCIRD